MDIHATSQPMTDIGSVNIFDDERWQKEEKFDWAGSALLIPHVMIRDALIKFETAVNPDNLFAKDGKYSHAKLVALVHWYDIYYNDAVHHHHDIEETIWLPWLKDAAKESGFELEGVSGVGADHETLMAEMDAHRKMLGEMLDFSDPKNGNRAKLAGEFNSQLHMKMHELHVRVTKFCGEMREHVHGEEKTFPDQLRKASTEAKHSKVIEKINMSLGLGAAAKMLPWIMHRMSSWATKEQFQKFWGELPPPFRFFMWVKTPALGSWMAAYLKNNVDVIDRLGNGTWEEKFNTKKPFGMFASCTGATFSDEEITVEKAGSGATDAAAEKPIEAAA